MWKLKEPRPVKLIIGILAADRQCLHEAVDLLTDKLGRLDFTSNVWPFNKTDYYTGQTGPNILRQFVTGKNQAYNKQARTKNGEDFRASSAQAGKSGPRYN